MRLICLICVSPKVVNRSKYEKYAALGSELLIAIFVACASVLSVRAAETSLEKPNAEAAKKEGNVVVYGTTILGDMTRLNQSFNQKFPTIKVDYFRSTGKSLIEKILNETRARRFNADIYQISRNADVEAGPAATAFKRSVSERTFVDEGGKDKEGYWTALYSNTTIQPTTVVLLRRWTFPAGIRICSRRSGKERWLWRMRPMNGWQHDPDSRTG